MTKTPASRAPASRPAPPAAETIRALLRRTATPGGLAVLFVAGFLLRVLLARGGGFPADIGIFQSWAARLAEVGPGDFYSPDVFADYPPGFLYVLWPLGELAKTLFDGTVPVFLLKLTAIVGDIGLAFVVMQLATRVAEARGAAHWWVRPAAAAAVLFNPPIVFLSAIWGQVDTVAALYALGGVLLVLKGETSPRHEAAGAALFALAFATKPQTAFLLPVVALVLVLRHAGKKPLDAATAAVRLGIPAVTFLLVWLALAVPFGLNPSELLAFYSDAGSTYPYTSVWAFNFWGVAGFWRADSGMGAFELLGVPAAAAGMVAFGAAACYVLIRVFRAIKERRAEAETILAGGAAIVCLSFALLTRIHERYLFLALACLAPLIAFRLARVAFAALSGLYMLNLFFPWVYYIEEANRSTLKIGWLFDLVYGTAQDSSQKKLLSLVTTVVCIAVAIAIWELMKATAARAATPAPVQAAPRPARWVPGLHPIGKKGAALGGIVFLILVPTRLAGLASPTGMYFDEIYHARTAGEYIAGKEAYEWTHPPLGKQVMALSMKTFSGWDAAPGREAPAGLDGGVVDSDGKTVAWAAGSAAGAAGVLWTAPLGERCEVTAATLEIPIDLVPSRIAVAPTGGAFVSGTAGGEPVVSRYSADALLWEKRLDSPVVDMAAAGEAVYVVDESGRLSLIDGAGPPVTVGEGAAAVSADPDTSGAWASFPSDKNVVAYDATGTSLGPVQLYEGAEDVITVPDADRVLALDTDTGSIESVDSQQRLWLDRMQTTATSLSSTPVKGLAYAVAGREVDVVEPRGLTVIGEVTLPSEPAALVPVAAGGSLMAVGEDSVSCVAGSTELAWRLPGALAGALLPALAFLLALRLSGNLVVAALTAALLAVEGLAFSMSRIGTLDSQATAHIVAAWLAAASVWFHAAAFVDRKTALHRRLGRIWLVVTGVTLGLAIATKWVGVYSFAILAGLMVVDLLARRERGIGALFPGLRTGMAAVVAAVVVLPLGIYLVSYIPYLSLGHTWGDLARLQKGMYDYHAQLKEGHPYSSPWYGWPIGHRSVALFGGTSGGENAAIWTIANPVVLVGGLWGMVWVTRVAWRRRLLALVLLPVAALAQFVPWVLVPRAAFLYHYLPVVPFLAIALARALTPETRGSRLKLYEAAVVMAAAVAVFALTLPELDGWYVSPEFHGRLQGWLPWLF